MSDNKKKESEVKEEKITETNAVDSVKEATTLSDLNKKEEILKEELAKVKTSKIEMTKEAPATAKSISELIMEQRKMRQVSEAEYLMKKAVETQARKLSNRNAVGSSPMNPIIIGKGK
jgi:hypothetical protein